MLLFYFFFLVCQILRRVPLGPLLFLYFHRALLYDKRRQSRPFLLRICDSSIGERSSEPNLKVRHKTDKLNYLFIE